MANPNNALGTNAAFGGRTSVNAFNDVMGTFENGGILSGWGCSPSSGLTVTIGGNGSTRDVAIAEDAAGNRTSVNNISGVPISVTMNAAPASNKRIDAIVIYLENNPSSSAVTDNYDAVNLLVVDGTASSSPSAPNDSAIRTAITADGASGSTAYYVVIAYITIASGTTDIDSSMIASGPMAKIGSQSIDFATYTATGYNETTIALNNSGQNICSLTIPSDGNYLIDGIVRVSSTGSSAATRNCWNQFTTNGNGTFSHSSEVGFAMNVQSGAVACIATIPVKNVLKNAKAGDTVTLRSRTNAATSDISAALGVISAIRVG